MNIISNFNISIVKVNCFFPKKKKKKNKKKRKKKKSAEGQGARESAGAWFGVNAPSVSSSSFHRYTQV